MNADRHSRLQNSTNDSWTDTCPPIHLLGCHYRGTSGWELSPKHLAALCHCAIAPPGAHWPGRTGSRLWPARLESRRGAALWGGTILHWPLPCHDRNTSSAQASERKRRSTVSINDEDRRTRTQVVGKKVQFNFMPQEGTIGILLWVWGEGCQ